MIVRRIAVDLRRQNWPTVFVEFMMVVLGVLLALQVDNWNEQRKERALFQNYVEQLQMDLRADIEDGRLRVANANDLDEAAAYLLSVIDATAPEPIDRARLIVSILTAGYANLNLIHRQTFDELVSTGNLRIFPDNEVKRAVVTYYSNCEIGSQWNPMIRSVQTNYRQAARHLLTADQFR